MLRHWTTLEILIVSSCLVAAGWSGYGLVYTEVQSLHDQQQENSLGRVTYQGEDVRVKSVSTAFWQLIGNRNLVFDQDQIFTGKSSEAQIHFNKGTSVQLNPNSLILIEKESKALRNKISLETGSFFSDLKKGATLVVHTQGRTTEIKGANAVMSFEKAVGGEVKLTVLSGQIEMTQGQTTSVVKKNEAVKVDEKGVVEKITYEIELVQPLPISSLWLGVDDKVHLAWSGVPQGQAVRLQIASDPAFKKIIVDQRVEGKTFDVALGAYSTFYWKVFLPPNEQSGGGSLVSSFTLLPKTPPGLVLPKMDQEFAKNESDESAAVDFIWNDRSQSSSYTFELAADENFHHLVHSEETAQRIVSVSGLRDGHYFWRVSGKRSERPQVLLSTVGRFSYAVQAAPAPFEPLNLRRPSSEPLPTQVEAPVVDVSSPLTTNAPAERPIVLAAPKWSNTDMKLELIEPSAQKRDEDLSRVFSPELIWSHIEGAQSYALEISNRDDFSNSILKISLSKETYTWANPPTGIFYLRVKAYAAGGVESPFSEVAKLHLMLSTPQVVEGILSAYNPVDQRTNLKLRWRGHGRAIQYEVQVADDSDFTTVQWAEITTQTKIELPVVGYGDKFARVRSLDENKKPSSRYSDSWHATIAAPPPSPPAAIESALPPPLVRRVSEIWLGAGDAKINFKQSGDLSSGSVQSEGPALYLRMRRDISDHWYVELNAESRQGDFQGGPGVVVSKNKYKWNSQELDFSYQIYSRLALRLGYQLEKFPLSYTKLSGILTLDEVSTSSGVLGFDYKFFSSEKWLIQAQLKSYLPLRAKSTAGDFKLKSATSYDASLEFVRILSERWRTGLFYLNQSRKWDATLNPADGSSAGRALLNLNNSEIQIRLGYEFP